MTNIGYRHKTYTIMKKTILFLAAWAAAVLYCAVVSRDAYVNLAVLSVSFPLTILGLAWSMEKRGL